MYANPLHDLEVAHDATSDADDKTVEWLKRDLERRRAEKAGSKELVSSK